MRKGKSIIGLNIISQNDATELGHVRDLIFDHDTDELLALLVSEKDLFGLIEAQIVPWSEVRAIGPNAVMVPSSESKIKAGDFPRVNDVMNRETALSGTRIVTSEGQEIGTLADMYIDDETGKIVGYEVSGGFFSDTLSGKRFMDAIPDMPIGRGVAVVPPEVATQFEHQRANEPGGLSGAAHTVGDKVSGAAGSAKDAVAGAYGNLASASIEKQKEFCVGKVASRDVALASGAAVSMTDPTTTGGSEIRSDASVLNEAPIETPSGAMLVRQGETITRAHADQAESAGILHQLVVAAGGTMTAGALGTAREHIAGGAAVAGEHAGGVGATLQGHAENAALGKTAGREVSALNGETIVAPGQTITETMLERARLDGKEKELIAAAGLGVASQGVDTVKEGAANLWDTVKAKAAELTGAAHEKKAEYDASAEQSKINNALGRPTTRVILAADDAVILNTGDLITHAAIDRAREAGALDVLLDSVYTADPEITPEMMRAQEPGEAALPTQAQPSGGPITATVAPGIQSQDTPSQ